MIEKDSQRMASSTQNCILLMAQHQVMYYSIFRSFLKIDLKGNHWWILQSHWERKRSYCRALQSNWNKWFQQFQSILLDWIGTNWHSNMLLCNETLQISSSSFYRVDKTSETRKHFGTSTAICQCSLFDD